MNAVATIDERKVRMNFEVPETLFKRTQEALPWGVRANVIRAILEIIVRSVERDGQMILGAIMSGECRLVYDPPGSVPELNAQEKKRRRGK